MIIMQDMLHVATCGLPKLQNYRHPFLCTNCLHAANELCNGKRPKDVTQGVPLGPTHVMP